MVGTPPLKKVSEHLLYISLISYIKKLYSL